MYFVMYVNEKKVDAILLPFGNTKITELIDTLKKRNREILKEVETEPIFAIEQVTSSINNFQSLKEYPH